VVDGEEEEEMNKMISLWKKQGKAGEGKGVILTSHGTVRRLCPHPLIHYFQYVPLDCTSDSVSGAKLSKTMRRLSITREGEGAGAMMSDPLVNGSSQTAMPFHISFIILVHGRGAFFNLHGSSPSSTSIIVTNFISRRLQLQSSLPTSSLVANFNPRRLQLQPSSPFNFQTPSLQFSIFSPSP
jgi:hypothetical protein